MPATKFDRNRLARWYAKQHRKIDPGVQAIYYLPAGAAEREIRLLEVNDLIAERNVLEPFELGVEMGQDSEHRVSVLDVTPRQWDRIKRSTLALPDGWTLEDAKEL